MSVSQMLILDRETTEANSATTSGSGQNKKMLNTHSEKRRRTSAQRNFIG
jgi:hypothetical protein